MKDLIKSPWLWLGVAFSSLFTFFLVWMLFNIQEKKKDSQTLFSTINEITDETEDPALWGISFPHHYDSYKKTVDQTRTKFGGSEAVPRIPTAKDPRTFTAQSRLDEDPRLKTMWAGYAFAVDFREERGHAYMLSDQMYTQRQDVVKQPGTCINCHASTYVAMKKLGNGDLKVGFEAMNKMPYAEAVKNVKHPVSCIDCHTPGTMKLRITKPAFMEGVAQVKASQGIKDYDVNAMASPQEMRTYVCAQCHVEYYFKGPEKRLVFPWARGLKADQILEYYQENQHKDWVHQKTKANVLKAQHPEFEMWNQGIHARSGVSCTDCHMPYQKVGAMKITNHHVQSPVLNLSHSCQTCHRWPESELKARIETIQGRTFEMRNIAMDALVEFINGIETADKKLSSTKGKNTEALDKARDYQRKAQFLLDFVEAENSVGFHAPQEAMRILGISLDYTRKGQNELNRQMKSVKTE